MNRMLALIGTGPHCKVRLHSAAVASIHCSLVCTAQGLWVVDLLGPCGVLVNEQKVRFAPLADGDRLRVDDFVMRVRCEPSPCLALAPALPRMVALPPTAPPCEQNPNSWVDSMLLPLVQQFSSLQNQMFDQFRDAMAMMFQMFGNVQKDQMELIRQELNRVQTLTQEIQALQAELQKQPGARQQLPSPDKAAPEGNALPAISRPGSAPVQTPATGPSEAKSSPEGETKTGADVHAWLCRRMEELQEDRRNRLQKILGFLAGK